MNKVVTISLNGNAYQLEEAGYDALRSYLDTARANLAANPDRDEILRDLEQAIAEKLSRLMGAHASVASEAHVAEALREMGPVDASTDAKEKSTPENTPAPRRLYRIREDKVLGGVCKGLSVYFDIDVVLVRLIFVALVVVTGGVWILIYILMMVIIPYADTPEKLSRVSGTPWNAQEILDGTRESLQELRKASRDWKREWKEEKRRMKWEARKYAHYKHCHHRSVIGDLVELAMFCVILWAVYHFIPASHPIYEQVGADIQQGWAWLNANVGR
ncbi:MAG: PspC domain-containing protein [Minisyncoccia bacterium]